MMSEESRGVVCVELKGEKKQLFNLGFSFYVLVSVATYSLD